MPVITLFEHESRAYRDFGLTRDHPGLEHIERLNDAHRAEMLRVGRNCLTATAYVGVWRVGGLVVQVLPKIDHRPAGAPEPAPGTPAYEQAVHSATRNLLRMLAVAGDFPITEQDLAPLATQPHDWLDLLTWLLAAGLHRQLQLGLERQYVGQEDDLPVVRGRWQLARQLARRPHVRHRFDVAYDEFREDTLLNRVFRYAAERLLPATRQPATRRLLADIRAWLSDVSPLHQSPRGLLDQVVFTRLNERFRPSFALARLFLENRAFELTAGAEDLSAFTFEMWRLFEAFIGRLLTRHRAHVLPPEWTAAHMRLQAEGRPLSLAERLPERQPVFDLRPDVLVEALDGAALLVLDTKYKQLDPTQRRLGVDQGDVYQMLAYAQRLRCPRLVLLYPQTAGHPAAPVVFELAGKPARLVAAAVDLHRPLDQLEPLVAELAAVMRLAAALPLPAPQPA
jgi:5-methylcytosine-specific restriction enzyme subunit McrC